jgi:polar amino acid transport system substrate-binding protein
MRVGIQDSEPWAVLVDGEAHGVEPRILEAFADELDAEIEWVPGSDEDLMGALHQREIDVVVGGITSTSPWVNEVTFTHPYLTTAVIVAAPELVEDIAGVEVAVEAGTEEAGLLEMTDARPIAVEDVMQAEGAVVIDNWLLDDLQLVDSGVRLREDDHVMAVQSGENAWIVRLERYLLSHEAEIKSLLEEEGKP